MSDAAAAADPAPDGLSRARILRPIAAVHSLLRSITPQQWAWTTAFGLAVAAAYLAGFAPRAFYLWRAPQLVAVVVQTLVAAYVLLVAITIAERRIPFGQARRRRYLIATVVAVIIVTIAETITGVLVPATMGWEHAPSVWQLGGAATSSLANWTLCGGLAMAVYTRLQGVRAAREAIRAAELARAEASREVLASRLAAMQAQVEPRFLLGTLGRVEAVYDRDLQGGARMLDGLIAYLRAALPQLRGAGSTLGSEARLARCYLDLVELQMGSRLEFSVDTPSELADSAMPPMLLLPLIDNALRSGLEPLPLGGRINVSAEAAGDRLRVIVTDSGLAQRDGSNGASGLAALHERLKALYGDEARLVVTAETSVGVTAVIDIPHETEGDHR